MEPHRRQPPRRGIGLRWTPLGVLVLLCAVCAVHAEEPARTNRPAAHITSNQSVSIDEPEAEDLRQVGADVGAAVVQDVEADEAGEPSIVEADPGVTAETSSEPGVDPRVIPRRGRGMAAPGAFARPAAGDRAGGEGVKRPTPWYRGGLGALATVLVLIVAVYWLVRRYLPAARAGESGVLRVAARTGLTPKQSLMLIRLPRRFVLVAVSQGRVDTLCAIDDAEEVADLLARVHAPAARGEAQFEDLLQAQEAEFDETEVRAAARSRGAGQPGSEALTGLLVKLRALTSKN